MSMNDCLYDAWMGILPVSTQLLFPTSSLHNTIPVFSLSMDCFFSLRSLLLPPLFGLSLLLHVALLLILLRLRVSPIANDSHFRLVLVLLPLVHIVKYSEGTDTTRFPARTPYMRTRVLFHMLAHSCHCCNTPEEC